MVSPWFGQRNAERFRDFDGLISAQVSSLFINVKAIVLRLTEPAAVQASQCVRHVKVEEKVRQGKLMEELVGWKFDEGSAALLMDCPILRVNKIRRAQVLQQAKCGFDSRMQGHKRRSRLQEGRDWQPCQRVRSPQSKVRCRLDLLIKGKHVRCKL